MTSIHTSRHRIAHHHSSSTSSSISGTSSSYASPILNNSSFLSLDYFAPPNSPASPSRLPVEDASHNMATVAWPTPHPHSHARPQSPSSPTSSDLHAVGVAALTTTPPSSPSINVAQSKAGRSQSGRQWRQTVLFPQPTITNFARPFRTPQQFAAAPTPASSSGSVGSLTEDDHALTEYKLDAPQTQTAVSVTPSSQADLVASPFLEQQQGDLGGPDPPFYLPLPRSHLLGSSAQRQRRLNRHTSNGSQSLSPLASSTMPKISTPDSASVVIATTPSCTASSSPPPSLSPSPAISSSSPESSHGPVTPDNTDSGDHESPRSTGSASGVTWQKAIGYKGLGIDKVRQDVQGTTVVESAQTATEATNGLSMPHQISLDRDEVSRGVQEVIMDVVDVEHETEDASRFSSASMVATAVILESYTDSPHGKLNESTSSMISASTSSQPFEYSDLLSSSSAGSVTSDITALPGLPPLPGQNASLAFDGKRQRAASTSARRSMSTPRTPSGGKIRRKAVPALDSLPIEHESAGPATTVGSSVRPRSRSSTGQSAIETEESPSSVAVPQTAMRAVRVVAQAVPTAPVAPPALAPTSTHGESISRKANRANSLSSSSVSSSQFTSSNSSTSYELLTPQTPSFPSTHPLPQAEVTHDAPPAADTTNIIEVKRVPRDFKLIVQPPTIDKRSDLAKYGGGYMTRSQTIAMQEEEAKEKEAKSRKGLGRFFKPDRS